MMWSVTSQIATFMGQYGTSQVLYSLGCKTCYHQGPLLLTWFNLNPSMDK